MSFASTTTTVCTVSSGNVTLVAAGECTIRATQAGDADYAAATPVTKLPGDQGQPDNYIRCTIEPDVRHAAVYRRRDGQFGTTGKLRLDYHYGLHGVERHCDAGGRGPVYNPCLASGRCGLRSGNARKPKLPGYALRGLAIRSSRAFIRLKRRASSPITSWRILKPYRSANSTI